MYHKLAIGICITIITMLVMFMIIGSLSTTNAIKNKIQTDLLETKHVFEYIQKTRFQSFVIINNIVTQTPLLRSLVSTPEIDHNTYLDSSQLFQETIQSDLFMLMDSTGKLLASASEPKRFGEDLSNLAAFKDSLKNGQHQGLWVTDKGVYQIVATPFLFGSDVAGVLLVGYEVNQAMLDNLERMTNTQISLLTANKTIFSSSVSNPLSKYEKENLSFNNFEENNVLLKEVDGEKFLLFNIPFTATGSNGNYILSRSLDKELLFFKENQLVILGFGLLILFGTLILASLFAKKFVEPIDDLVKTSKFIAQGNFDSRVTPKSNDELAVLANAFNDMVTNLQNTTFSKKYVEGVLETMTNTVVVLDGDEKIKMVNQAIYALTDYNEEDLINCPFRKLFYDQKNKNYLTYERIFKEIKQKNIVHNKECNITLKKQGIIPVLLSIAHMPSSHSENESIVCVIQDISMLKAMELNLMKINTNLKEKQKEVLDMYGNLDKAHEELKDAQDRLLQSEKMASIGQLAAGVAHEINNPLGFVGMNLDVLNGYLEYFSKILDKVQNLQNALTTGDSEKSRNISSDIQQFKEDVNLDTILEDSKQVIIESQDGIDRIKTIIKDLRAFSHEGRSVESENPFIKTNVQNFLDKAIGLVWNELKHKIELKKDYGETVYILGDEARLIQVFMNLFVNASHAMQTRGTLTLKIMTKNDFVHIDVKDTGEGIPKENLAKIFDAFYTSKDVGVGTGLGLSISYEIIKLHNGEINVESEVGAGTTFKIQLPLFREAIV